MSQITKTPFSTIYSQGRKSHVPKLGLSSLELSQQNKGKKVLKINKIKKKEKHNT